MYRSLFRWFAFSFGILFLFTTCAEEIKLDFPFASLSRENGLVFKDTTLCVGQAFSVKLRLNAGAAKMTQLAIYEEEELLSLSRLSISGAASVISNPIQLTGGDENSAVYNITINPSVTDSITKDYTFRVVDELNQPAAIGVNIKIGYPVIDFIDAPNKTFSDTSIFIGIPIRLRMNLTDCWQELSELQIYEEGVLLSDNQISIRSSLDSSIVNTSNPIQFKGENRRQFIYDIEIDRTPVTLDSTIQVYTFQLLNDRDQITHDTIRILNVEPTPLKQDSLIGTLYNQAIEPDNPNIAEGFGGLDLDTGNSVDADSPEAEIQDEGVLLRSDSTVVWRQQISVVDTNDTQIRSVNLPFGQDFGDFMYREQIIDLFNRSRVLNVEESYTTNPLPVSDIEQGERVSEEIEVGAIFVLRRAGAYYLVKCVGLDIDTDGNADSYRFIIKDGSK